MKQIIQNLSNGETSLTEIPCPKNTNGNILIKSSASLVSSGTERMLVEFGKSNLFEKAKKQPDKVHMVVEKARKDGLLTTIDTIRSKLDQPLALGYCNAGVVLETTSSNFSIGDRVVSNGSHAEVVRVPKNLCAKIPDNVDNESACFTVLAAVGLQGIRLIKPSLGESFVVTGLGLVGLLCVQILRANGCRVLGIDYDSQKCKIAKEFGAEIIDLSLKEDPILAAKNFSKGKGVDGVVIAASTNSDEVIHQSAQMCRIRGRIVLIGVVGLNLRRDDFYKKEITFQVSSSYGPGRYDPNYEEMGNDYPYGFVRWTEQRNFEAVLDMMSNGSINVKALISSKFDFDDAVEAYSLLGKTNTLGIVLKYSEIPENKLRASTVTINNSFINKFDEASPRLGFIGAGNYASRVLIPAFKKTGVILDSIVTSSGVSGTHHGNKNGFLVSSTDISDLWNDLINTVVIATKHDSHASLVLNSIKNVDNIFVEKPLALTIEELEKIDLAYKSSKNYGKLRLMVGFNRRFAPHIIRMKELLQDQKTPKSIIITVNAGQIDKSHWVQDPLVGGGRVIGEACHFIDLMLFLVGSPIKEFQTMMIGNSESIEVREDKASISILFEDGSMGTIHYLANGGNIFPKERVEVFCQNAVLKMDNYRELKGYGWPGFNKMKLFKQDKGQLACVQAFIDSIKHGMPSPIPYIEILESSRVAIEIAHSLREIK